MVPYYTYYMFMKNNYISSKNNETAIVKDTIRIAITSMAVNT